MERSAIREPSPYPWFRNPVRHPALRTVFVPAPVPDCASLHPGYRLSGGFVEGRPNCFFAADANPVTNTVLTQFAPAVGPARYASARGRRAQDAAIARVGEQPERAVG